MAAFYSVDLDFDCAIRTEDYTLLVNIAEDNDPLIKRKEKELMILDPKKEGIIKLKDWIKLYSSCELITGNIKIDFLIRRRFIKVEIIRPISKD